MSVTKQLIQRWLRRAGFDLRQYQYSVEARRQQILEYYDIDLLVDVGANIGQYARAAREHGYRRRLLSLEPLQAPYSALVEAASGDPLWETRRTAAGAERGEITIRVSEGSIFSSVLPVLEATRATSSIARQVGEESVPLCRLDDLVPDPNEHLAVKIDVQGFERSVFDGAPVVLQHARVVEMELSPSPVYAGQMLMLEALERMANLGYELSLTENLLRQIESGRSLQFNGIFVRP